MNTNFVFSLIPLTRSNDVEPIVETKTKLEREVRVGGKGLEWNSESCQEINRICDEIGLGGDELCEGLEEFDNYPLTRLSLQSYKQGNVLGQESYMALLARLRPYLAMRRKMYGHLMQSDAVSIINGWMKLLKIDMKDTKRSPWKLFSEKIGKVNKNGKLITIDHTTIYRWYQNNKKPASISDLIWYDETVKSAANKL